MNDRLDRYRERRDFDRSPEPNARNDDADTDARRYVIQHHDASSEHWDFRLEHRGVLLSWAVPKGPSTDPREKRLAVRTEDHPLDYADFEGVIPEDEYGGGSVIVWDTGSWRPHLAADDDSDEEAADGDVDASIDEALADGHLAFEVTGEKLRGGYVLQRFRGDDQWLLIKRDDDDADARRNPTSTQPESVLSGRTVDEVGEESE